MNYKAFKAVGVEATDDGIIEAFVSVFDNVDYHGERVKFGAFAESISVMNPKVCLHHNLEKPIGKTLKVEEVPAGDDRLPASIKDFGGLYVQGAFNLNTIDGKDAFEHIKFGSIDEYSFGFEILESKAGEDGVNELTKLNIFEWSPVTLGANNMTATVSAKNKNKKTYDETCDELDTVLNDLVGYTKSKHEMRKKEGRTLSTANRERIRGLAESLSVASKDLYAMYQTTEPRKAIRRQTLKLRLQLLSTNEN